MVRYLDPSSRLRSSQINAQFPVVSTLQKLMTSYYDRSDYNLQYIPCHLTSYCYESWNHWEFMIGFYDEICMKQACTEHKTDIQFFC